MSASSVALDHGYNVWSVHGAPLQQYNVPGLYMVAWRPRMKIPLTPDHHESIKKRWREYSVQFEAEDKLNRMKASIEVVEKRRAMAQEWNDKVSAAKARAASVAERLVSLRPQLLSRKFDEVEEVNEIFLRDEISVI